MAQQIASKDSTHSPQYQRKVAIAFHTRIKELKTYSPDYPKIQSTVRLFKPSTLSVTNFADDYKLGELCANLNEVKVFEGNHITIVENSEVADTINGIFGLRAPVTASKAETNETFSKEGFTEGLVTKEAEEVKQI